MLHNEQGVADIPQAVEVYGEEGYELGRRSTMGIGGIESADAGKAVAGLCPEPGPHTRRRGFRRAGHEKRVAIVEEGDRVRRGQVLVKLQDDEQRSALAKVESQLGTLETSGAADPTEVAELRELGGLSVDGLMAIPPPGDEVEARRHFTALRRLAESSGATAHLTVADGAPVLGGGERKAHIFDYLVSPAIFPPSCTYVALGHLHNPHELAAPVLEELVRLGVVRDRTVRRGGAGTERSARPDPPAPRGSRGP